MPECDRSTFIARAAARDDAHCRARPPSRRNTTSSSDVFAQARNRFIQRLDAAISAADDGFEVVEDLP
jgi:hypothetical protein